MYYIGQIILNYMLKSVSFWLFCCALHCAPVLLLLSNFLHLVFLKGSCNKKIADYDDHHQQN